jgi:hypothetical protein
MGKVSVFCVALVIFAVLMEDVGPAKKTEKEEREDKELAAAVNRTLAEEEMRREDDEKKRKQDQGKSKIEEKNEKVDKPERQDEACPPVNVTCPVIKPCPPQKDCPENQPCPEQDACPEVEPCKECPPCRECLSCKPCKECGRCPEVRPCEPCGPDSVANITNRGPDLPVPPSCLETSSMSVPAALLVGASAGVLVTGVATTIGLLLRYSSPVASGFIFVATIIIVWFLSSHYPETARELGGRAATLLREAATALSHRIVEALRHHNEQVGFPILVS